ncbi:MAG: NAD(P)H-dependent glycerol-3-phosphate dehydrogenase [Pyrinomonadaceae bacterium]
MKRLTIIGAGSWGTALAIIAGHAGHYVRLWSHNADVTAEINAQHLNSRYLASLAIPPNVAATCDMPEALRETELVVLASPSHVTRELCQRMMPFVQPQTLFVSATKGIETETGKRISQVLRETFGERFEPRFVCLSGPSFAHEVAAGQPTAIVAASLNEEDSRCVQSALSFRNLRIYTNTDVIGTELGGSVKNVMAVAAGIVAGLGLGTNSIAALVTRGLAEIARFALAQGARLETMTGLAGMGDLVLTCTGNLSRNRRVGYELGRGRALADILGEMHEVAEGVKTTHAVKKLAAQTSVEMPITNEVYAVLYEGKTAREAAHALMARPLREEFYG